MPAPNTLKRWNGSIWQPIFDADAYLLSAGDFMSGPLTLRNANLIGTDAPGTTEWGRVIFGAATTTLQATGARTLAFITNGVARVTVADTVVTSTVPIGLPAQATSGMTAVNAATRKDYVDGLVSPLLSSATAATTYVNVTGDTVSGTLQVNGALTMGTTAALSLKPTDPTGLLEAVPLGYLNTQISTVNTAIGTKVAKTGDSMSGTLFLSSAAIQEKIRLSGMTMSYISGYTFTTPPPSARIGYLQFIEGLAATPPHSVRLVADTGNNVELHTGGAIRLTVDSAGAVNVSGPLTTTSTVTVAGAITANSTLTTTGTITAHGPIVANDFIILNDVPTDPTHAVRKFDLDTATAIYRWRATRAAASVAVGDVQHGGTYSNTENTGGFPGVGTSASPVNVPVAGSYAITQILSGGAFTGASAVWIVASGVSHLLPIQPGSTARVGGTIVVYLAGGSDIYFQIRNQSAAAVTCSQITEVVRVG